MRDDGGPAFPSVGEGFGNPNYSAEGMSLRDWFAGQALITRGARRTIERQKVARECYMLADAMVKEREREP